MVCDLKASSSDQLEKDTSDVPVQVFEKPDRPKAKGWKKKQIQDQKGQLEELLSGHVPSVVQTDEEYGIVRGKLALLKAFRRKLLVLLEDSMQKGSTAKQNIAKLEEQHPEYRQQLQQHYQTALKQSGIQEDNVSFMKFLRDGA